MLNVRPAREDDLAYLAENLRDTDLAELKASGVTPEECLQVGFAGLDCEVVVNKNDLPVCVMGANPLDADPKVAVVWMLTTNKMGRLSRFVASHGREWLESLASRRGYFIMLNQVHLYNMLHRKWLKHLKFKTLQRNGEFLLFARAF